MSEQDANNWTPEQAAASGYPVPDSSPAPGADDQGTPPVPSGAPPAPAQQPGPDHPRFNEVYKNWKDTERELESARDRLARYESLEQPMGAPPPPPQYEQPTQGSPQDDPEAWLKNTVAEAVKEHVAPLQQTLAQQQQAQRLAQAAAQFRAAHPNYDDARDGPALIGTFQRYGGNVPLEDCYKVAFPERFAQAQQAPQGAPAPVADVPSSAPETPFGTETPESLMAKLADPNLTAYAREQIGAQLRDMGAWGMGAVEKALGYQ